jgi:exonuclease VII small subunit
MFEEGISLARVCAKRLEDAELQVKTLVKSDDGQFKLELFGKDE